MGLFSGPGLTPSLKGLATNKITLKGGQVFNIPGGEAGWYMVNTGKYATFQQFDPISQMWVDIGGGSIFGGKDYVYMDGTSNYRFANLTGCCVGAVLTACGAGYTSPPTITATTGNSLWRAILGGAVNTTVVVSNGGLNYSYPPIVLFSAPPAGGLQATGYAVLTGAVVTSIVVVNQGAGYVTPPTVTLVNDSREGVNGVTQGYGATAVATLTGAGTVTGLVCIDPGVPITSTTAVPTLTFTGGGYGTIATAIALMCWSITSFTTSGGSGFGSEAAAWLTAEDNFGAIAASIYANPATQSNLVKIRKADIYAAISGGTLTATGSVVYDGGIYTSVPLAMAVTASSAAVVWPTLALVMGSQLAEVEFTPV